MKRLSVTTFAVVGITMSLTAVAAEIHAPAEDALIYHNTIELAAVDESATGVQWAVRFDTCDRGTGTKAGNVDGYNDDYTFADGFFEASVNSTYWGAGRYCFVLNSGTNRLTQWFYIVDEYAKVSGTIKFAPDGDTRPAAPFDPMPGKSPTHTFDGVIGNAGPSGTVGSIDINYRQLKQTCTLNPEGLSLDNDAPGIVNDANLNLRAKIPFNSNCGDGTFFALDKSINMYSNLIGPRGGIVMRVGGASPVTDFHIDNSLGTTGGTSWVSLERGNAEVGTR